jgi:hypothetical protein
VPAAASPTHSSSRRPHPFLQPPSPPPFSSAAGEPFPPSSLLPSNTCRASGDRRAAGLSRAHGDLFPAVGVPLDLAVPPATLPLAAAAPPSLAAPPVTFSPAPGVPPGPAAPPVTLYSAAGALPSTAASLAALPSVASALPTVAPLCAPSPLPARRRGTPSSSPLRCPHYRATSARADPSPDGSRSAPVLSLPDAALLHSQLLVPGFPHVPLDTTGGAPVRGCSVPTTVYSQLSAITSSLRAPSDDAAALLAATRAAVTAARQRAQDAARALEQEQAVVDAIERQYAETYHRLADKGVSDGSPTSTRHNADTFEPTPAPASTLRASLHAQAAALTSIRATVIDVLAPDSTQYPWWRDQVLQTPRRYALADHILSAVPDPSEDWLLMDEVVLSWIHGTLTTELQDIVRVADDTAHRI